MNGVLIPSKVSVHLHAGGGVVVWAIRGMPGRGSSPRGWRRLAPVVARHVFGRFISTRVEASRRSMHAG